MIIYTDGASSPDRAGGWAWVVSETQKDSGAACDTTNQRMEIYAAIEALNAFGPGDMTIVSDSRYVVDCMTRKWYAKWRKNGWKTRDGNPVISQDLWEQLLAAVARHRSVKFTWVKGHSGDPLNDFADRLAVRAKEEGREERQRMEQWNVATS
jgi:ribonuclease HI